ncbi:MAG TPA: Hpt domain-containing protein [Caulobacteraceae bacterium]
MSASNAAEVFRPANTLKARFGGKFSLDPGAVARAEAALQGLSAQFGQWMQDELNKLDIARAAVAASGLDKVSADSLYLRAHDLKGLGGTYQYPIVSRIAGSLCRLLDDSGTRAEAPLPLIDAHIQAIKAAVRDGIRDEEHPVGLALATELEAKVHARSK